MYVDESGEKGGDNEHFFSDCNFQCFFFLLPLSFSFGSSSPFAFLLRSKSMLLSYLRWTSPPPTPTPKVQRAENRGNHSTKFPVKQTSLIILIKQVDCIALYVHSAQSFGKWMCVLFPPCFSLNSCYAAPSFSDTRDCIQPSSSSSYSSSTYTSKPSLRRHILANQRTPICIRNPKAHSHTHTHTHTHTSQPII